MFSWGKKIPEQSLFLNCEIRKSRAACICLKKNIVVKIRQLFIFEKLPDFLSDIHSPEVGCVPILTPLQGGCLRRNAEDLAVGSDKRDHSSKARKIWGLAQRKRME